MAGLIYAHLQGIPERIALKVLPAFLLEITFFLVLGIESWRRRLETFSPFTVAAILTLAAIVPYSHRIVWNRIVPLAHARMDRACWPPRHPSGTWRSRISCRPICLFLVFMAVVWISRILRNQYISPYPRLQMDVLAHLMWVRTGTLALLSVRRMSGVGFGFLPEAREWRIGLGYFPGVRAGGRGAGLVDRIRQPALAVRLLGTGSSDRRGYVLERYGSWP